MIKTGDLIFRVVEKPSKVEIRGTATVLSRELIPLGNGVEQKHYLIGEIPVLAEIERNSLFILGRDAELVEMALFLVSLNYGGVVTKIVFSKDSFRELAFSPVLNVVGALFPNAEKNFSAVEVELGKPVRGYRLIFGGEEYYFFRKKDMKFTNEKVKRILSFAERGKDSLGVSAKKLEMIKQELNREDIESELDLDF